MNPRKQIHVFALTVALASVLACASHQALNKRDAWLNSPPNGWVNAATVISASEVYRVSDDKQMQAVAQLLEAPAIALSNITVGEYLKSGIVPNEKKHYYLVRALYLNDLTGYFSVYSKDSEIYIQHSCLGHKKLSMTRCALVISLNDAPTAVYVTCSMAE